jgi:hypothetical protein
MVDQNCYSENECAAEPSTINYIIAAVGFVIIFIVIATRRRSDRCGG